MKPMKILLIFPDLRQVVLEKRLYDRFLLGIRGVYPPLGLAYLAGALAQAGQVVKIIDCNAVAMSDEKLAASLRAFGPEMVGLHCSTLMVPKVRRLARLVKSGDRNCRTVIGGPQLAVYPEETMQCPDFDIGVIGEGEITLVELAAALAQGQDLSRIAGLIFKKDQQLVRTAPRPYLNDLDRLAFPAWHLLPLDKYRDILTEGGRYATMITSRGCPFNCLICSPAGRLGKRFRYRSADNVVDEMELLSKHFGVETICFYDDTFTLNPARVYDLCQTITRRKISIRWECRTRVDLVDPDLLAAMAAAGCYRIRYGLESGNNALLKQLQKGITVAQIQTAVNLTRQAGLEVLGYFMLGCPDETPATIQQTLALSRQLPLDYANFNLMTLRSPQTGLMDWAAKRRYIDPDYWQRFTDGEKLDPAPLLITENLSERRLKYYQLKALAGFYGRPGYLLQTLLCPAKRGRIKNLVFLIIKRIKNSAPIRLKRSADDYTGPKRKRS